MNDWVENEFESGSYEEDSDAEKEQQVIEEVVQQVIEQVIEEQLELNESEEDQQVIEDEEQHAPVNESAGTITYVEGTVHDLPSASRLASNRKLYETEIGRKKPCVRCGFPCATRSLKCDDKERCKYVMIKSTTYKRTEKTQEELTAAARIRLKADYDQVVDTKALYENYKSESPVDDDRNQVLGTHPCLLLFL